MPTNNELAEKAKEAMANAAAKASDLKPIPVVSDEDAEDIAKLKAYVNGNNLAMTDGGKTYLRAEAWQYILRLKGVTPIFESASEVHSSKGANGKEVRQYIVTTSCELRDIATNNVISRATMIASNKETFLNNKPLYATWGMSQTRALSRAVRNVYGYLAVGAGFQATPWEEVNNG